MNSASPHDVRYPANFLAVASAADEDRLLRLCASAVLERSTRRRLLFQPLPGARRAALSLHFRSTHNMQELLRAVSAGAAADPRPFAADFLPIVLDPKAALGDVFGGVDSLAVYAAFSFDSAPLLWRWSAQGMAAPALCLLLRRPKCWFTTCTSPAAASTTSRTTPTRACSCRSVPITRASPPRSTTRAPRCAPSGSATRP
ncbi:hypothetical protein LP420_15960 [Massilia sp. B-10]|nr:hypothetical protein LP420_15960 [Massilia sp. B-10]